MFVCVPGGGGAVRACVHACVCVCVRACVRACVCVSVHARAQRVCVRVRIAILRQLLPIA